MEPIVTKRLILRPLVESDADAIFNYRSLPGIRRFQNWVPEDAAEVRGFIRTHTYPKGSSEWLQLGMTLRESGTLIGDLGLHFIQDENQQVEIGATLAPEYQGKGYAFEGVTGALDYLFHTLNTHRVFASIDPRNQASIKLVKRLGMRKEAHFVKSLRFKGQWADDLIYALLIEEWRSKEN